MDSNNINKSSSVADFYKNKSIFVTGATGFLGKTVVEKLLQSCPDIGTIYVLIRPKLGTDISSRLNQLLEGTFFDKLRTANPKALAKVIQVAGDIGKAGLDLSEDDQNLLIREVSIVIHSAATVKFDQKLKCAMNLNFHGTERLIDICKRMKNLVALIHVSTAYAHCDRKEINERIYPAPVDPNDLVKRLECLSDTETDVLTPEIIGKKPNTYTFTKALTETILHEACGVLPIAIIRPSIVTGSWKEPIPGFVDNMNGATGATAGIGKGVIRTLLCHRENVAEFIPLDITVNLIISAAWAFASEYIQTRKNGIAVYNCCSGAQNPLFWKDIEEITNRNCPLYPPSNLPWTPRCIFRSSEVSHIINDFIWHFIPFAIMDILARLTGEKLRMLRVYRKVKTMTQAFQYFTTREWNFKTDNMVALHSKLSPTDKILFNFDVKEIVWEDYLLAYGLGVRTHVLKEDMDTIPAARRHLKRIQTVYKIIQVALLLLFMAILLRILF